MSTPQPARLPEQDDESSTRKEENLSTESQPRTHRRERRFELGFFVRKVVNGWVVFYKQFPPEKRYPVFEQLSGLARKEADAPDGGERRMLAMSSRGSGSTDSGDRTVTPQDSLGPGGGDPGPVGSTRVEAGLFASTTVESTDDDKV